MRRPLAVLATVLATVAGVMSPAHAQRSLVVYCSHDADACDLAAQTFQRETGIATSITRKATGEYYAQIRAERDSPRADVWYGGTIDPLLQAASEGLLAAYRSPQLAELAPWARAATEKSDYKVAAIYRMAIISGAPHPDEARAFYDWALTRGAQELANRTRNLIIPANAAATIRPEAARFAQVATLDVDPAKFGQPDYRKRLLARWQREVGDR